MPAATRSGPSPVDGPHRSFAELQAGWEDIRRAPSDGGVVEMLVARPAQGERHTPSEGRLTVEDGLVGDNWRARGSRRTEDGAAHPDKQLTLINRRLLEHVAGARERWPLAGDQLVVDLDLGEDNLRPTDRLRIGEALVEVTAEPHTGCAKFVARYGRDALRFVSTPEGRRHRLRGVYVRVVRPGIVLIGDRCHLQRRGGRPT